MNTSELWSHTQVRKQRGGRHLRKVDVPTIVKTVMMSEPRL